MQALGASGVPLPWRLRAGDQGIAAIHRQPFCGDRPSLRSSGLRVVVPAADRRRAMIQGMLTDRQQLPGPSLVVADMVAGRRSEIDTAGLALATRG